MKRIAIVGPIPRDHIVTHNGELIQKWGCVTHTPSSPFSIMGQEQKFEIVPVIAFAKGLYLDNVKEVFKGYRGLSLSHSYPFQKTTRGILSVCVFLI